MARQRRVFQIAEKIRNVLAMEILQLANPRFNLVTITSVVVSTDLSHAKVYWVRSGNDVERMEVQAAFDSAAKMLRQRVAADLGTRFVPDLRFYYDDTLDTAEAVEKLFAKIATQNKESE
jgi:ribosome-binding factor A